MKNRIISALLALILAAALTGCSSAPARGDISKEDTTVNNSTEDTTADIGADDDAKGESDSNVTASVKDGNTYSSSVLGAKITIDEGWEFASDEEMAALNEAVISMAGDDYAAQFENADILYDMSAMNTTSGDNISVNFENLGLLYGKVLSPETYLNLSESSVKDVLGNMGFENIETSIGKVQFAGNEESAMFLKAEIQGIPVYEVCVAKSCGKHMANITIATYLEDTTADILAKFAPID